MKPALLFSVMLLLAGVGRSQQISYHPGDPRKPVNPIFPKKERFDLKATVAKMAAYASVEGSAIGYSGSRSEQYDRFLLLLAAPEDELVKLTDHYSACVKAYAFQALAVRKSSQVREILKKHIYDVQQFTYFSGCIKELTSINNWFLQCAAPMLTKEEEAAYRRLAETSN